MNFKKEIDIAKYEFHKWRKTLIITDIIISLAVIILLAFIRPDYLVIAVFFLAIPYIILTQRKVVLYHFLIAALVAFVWMIIANNQYSYNQDFLKIAGINLFPLFAWAIGLFSMYIIYSYLEHLLKERGFIKKIVLFCIIFFPILIIMETFGYHTLNIHNLAASQFEGLPICNCLHAPHWMQFAYFAMGPIFFTICYLLKLENPHFKAKSSKKKRM
ncbi:MAG: hypothetical protein WC796_04925 [Candidatus Pacearchaeota archaeon]|jgi:hypothetical protein